MPHPAFCILFPVYHWHRKLCDGVLFSESDADILSEMFRLLRILGDTWVTLQHHFPQPHSPFTLYLWGEYTLVPLECISWGVEPFSLEQSFGAYLTRYWKEMNQHNPRHPQNQMNTFQLQCIYAVSSYTSNATVPYSPSTPWFGWHCSRWSSFLLEGHVI